MTFVFLFLLAVAWAWYLFTWLSSRREQHNVNSISSFSKHLSVLERTSPARAGFSTVEVPAVRRSALHPAPTFTAPAPGMTLSQAQLRRRNVLFGLGAAALVTLALAGLLGGTFVMVHLVCDALLVGYVALLARMRRLAEEQALKVHYLHDEHLEVDDDLAFEPAYLAR